jgi:hypothetical protein
LKDYAARAPKHRILQISAAGGDPDEAVGLKHLQPGRSSSWPGLTSLSKKLLRRLMDTRVKPAYDEY